jgi:hypothetical protein
MVRPLNKREQRASGSYAAAGSTPLLHKVQELRISRPLAHHKGTTRAANQPGLHAGAVQAAISGADLAPQNAPQEATAHRFSVRTTFLTCVELWGFEPQTSCMP